MRDGVICFRGKSKPNGEWVEGYFVGNCTIIPYDKVDDVDDIDSSLCRECYPGTIGQFTNLHDKNGKWIYEGDIVKLTPRSSPPFTPQLEYVGYVSLRKYSWSIVDSRKGFGYAPIEEIINNNFIEVIGNIHDNPELLKDGRD